jgi:hypothetical protein
MAASRSASGETLQGRVKREVIFCAAAVLSATPLTYFLRRDDSEFVEFCLPTRMTRRPLPSSSVGRGCR